MINIALHGQSGRMGQALSTLIAQDSELQLTSYADCDIIIDFSHPQALPALLERALASRRPLLIGTTGIQDRQPLIEASRQIPLLFSANFSLGVFALKQAAKAVADILGESALITLIEEHHTQKKDAPSGTALLLKESLQRTFPIFSLRTPGTIGNHTLMFSTEEEEITLTHRAKSRLLFARGALLAAKKLLSKPIGYYELQDII
jgi:4-hydroxy-tetrahydrodipicolinate reductase